MPIRPRIEDNGGSFLCPTELDRARAVEASGRVRIARAITMFTLGPAVIVVAAEVGWWALGLFALLALDLFTLEWRMKRSTTPENSAARSQLLALLILGVGVALSGGPDSPVLPWAVIPGAMAAARFRWQVVVLGAAITAVVVLLSTVAVDPEGALDDPAPVVVTLALLVCVTSITSVLLHGELLHRNRAVLDPLTGLLNRTSLETRVEEIEQQARLTGEPGSLVLADLDGFKRVNDEHGHDRGDAALRQVADQMRASLRSFELVYRIGGEEFLVLLPGIELREATQIAERMRCAVADARPADLELTMSAGVACTAGELSYDTLFKAADEALLEAKREGRNRVRAAPELAPVPNPQARRS